VSRAVAQGAPLTAPDLALAAAAALFIHCLFLIANTALVRLFKLGGPDGTAAAIGVRRAVILVASQKTLPVVVSVLSSMGAALGDAVGIAAVACVLAHLGQILFDSVRVSSSSL
jgi:sodium/bile acid cotransporter 7